MDNINYQQLIEVMIKSIVQYDNDVVVKQLSHIEDTITFQVLVNREDAGRVIGKNGRITSAMRNIVNSASYKAGHKIKINIDSF